MSNELEDDVKKYANKRQRRNAIKPNSLESIALRDFSLQAQMGIVSLGTAREESEEVVPELVSYQNISSIRTVFEFDNNNSATLSDGESSQSRSLSGDCIFVLFDQKNLHCGVTVFFMN